VLVSRKAPLNFARRRDTRYPIWRMSDYAAAVQSLLARTAELTTRRKFDPEHMRILAHALGDPQRHFTAILIAGTNGKGSTAATLAAILAAAHIRTGLYTSPHLSRINERIRVQGQPIADEDFARLYFQVDDTANQLVASGELPCQPSFFETVTAIAFLAFANRVDIAVLEVGLGGRLDATNIVDPLLSILTDIDIDHTEWLGPTLTHIAREKAGILRQNGWLVTLPQHPEANQVIGEVATALDVAAINAAEYMPYKTTQPDQLQAGPEEAPDSPGLRNRYTILFAGAELQIDSPLAGQHQQRNIALAIAAAVAISNQYGYEITAADIARGVADTNWPGRLELIPGAPAILLDVAHNPAGAWTLRAALSDLDAAHPCKKKTLLFGCLADKPADQLAQILFPLFDELVLTRPTSPRAADPTQLATLATTLRTKSQVVDQPAAALEAALAVTPPEGLLVIAGSVYLVGELRPILIQKAPE